MCIAVFAWRTDPSCPFILLLNRDEYFNRPTTPLGWWEGGLILGGRDRQAGGTWLACTRDGKLAFLTNVRENQSRQQLRTRGDLPLRFFMSRKSPKEFGEELMEEANQFNGFNLIVADLCSMSMVYITNRPKDDDGLCVTEVSPGIHVLSNAKLDTPWPKHKINVCMHLGLSEGEILQGGNKDEKEYVEQNLTNLACFNEISGLNTIAVRSDTLWKMALRLRHGFEDVIGKFIESEISLKEMTKVLMKDTTKDEGELPGIYPRDFEYLLTSIFVEATTPLGKYGTRSTSAIVLRSGGALSFYESHVENDSWRDHAIKFNIHTDQVAQ